MKPHIHSFIFLPILFVSTIVWGSNISVTYDGSIRSPSNMNIASLPPTQKPSCMKNVTLNLNDKTIQTTTMDCTEPLKFRVIVYGDYERYAYTCPEIRDFNHDVKFTIKDKCQ